MLESGKLHLEMEKLKEKLKTVQALPARARRLLSLLMNNPAMRNLSLCLAELALGFLLAGGAIAGRPMPFAVALIAVSATPLRALSAMLGSAMGYLYFWSFTGGLEYLAVSVLVFAAVCIVGGADLSSAPWFMPALSAAMSMIVGLLFLLQAQFAPSAVVWYIARLAIAAAATWTFGRVITHRTPGASLFAAACCLSGCASITIAGGVTLGQILAVSLGAASAGAPCCLLLCAAGGLAVDIAVLPPVSLTALLCFAGILCTWTRFRLRAARMLVYLTAVTAGVLFTGGQMPELVISAALGCCISVFLPESIFLAHGAGGVEAARANLSQAAEVLSGIHLTLEAQRPAPVSDAAAIFDRASDRVCGNCVLWGQCWQQRSTETYHALCAVARPMLERGAVARDDFPQSFMESCCHLDSLIAAINRELDNLACRRQYQNRLQESRAILSSQYAFLTDYLRQTAEHLEQDEAPPLSYTPELGVSAAGKPGHAISGDRGACFRTPEGMYYILLCDGMGTGPEAAAESSSAITLLSNLIRAGVAPRSALQTLNGTYILRGDGGFSTVDLLAVSLVTGEATLYKWGAAPSYLKTETEAKKIGTASPPPGFGVGEAHKAAEFQLSLRHGEFLILLSDGAGGEDAVSQITAWKDGAPKALAAALITSAKTNGEDDMTAVALRLRPCSSLT